MLVRVNHFNTLVNKIHCGNVAEIIKHADEGNSKYGAWRIKGFQLNPFRSEEYSKKLKELRPKGVVTAVNIQDLKAQIAGTPLAEYISKHIAKENHPVLGVLAEGETQLIMDWVQPTYYSGQFHRPVISQPQLMGHVRFEPHVVVNTNVQQIEYGNTTASKSNGAGSQPQFFLKPADASGVNNNGVLLLPSSQSMDLVPAKGR